MATLRLLLAAVLLLGAPAAAVRAEEARGGEAAEASLGVLVDAIRSNRKALVAANLDLTDDEAARFWPAYARYRQEMDAIGDRLVAMIQDYTASFGDLSDEKAMKLTDQYLGIEGDRIRVKRSYLDEFAKLLPGRKVARLYQIENKMDAVIRYDLAATIPVVSQQPAPAASQQPAPAK